MPNTQNILALNAGSSSLKYCLFAVTPEDATELKKGLVEHAGDAEIKDAAKEAITQCKPLGITAVGHRVVHGGAKFIQPTRVTPSVITELHSLKPLDPLHNPTEVAMIETALKLLPDLPSVAVFDTAFHSTMPEVAWRYALPYEFSDKCSLRRYGFHGISHRYVSERFLEYVGRDAQGSRLITCHLGSGASVCAILHGKSLDTSMGLTPLEGLVMGTRAGDIDPGLLIYLMRTHDFDADMLETLLNKQSGLLGLSGLSNDVRELEKAAQAGNQRAQMAVEIFAYRVRKYIGAYATAMNGVDTIILTGGIGEHSAFMRARILDGLSFLGCACDPPRNQASQENPMRISTEQSSIQAWVVRTNEEKQIAREVFDLLQ